MVNAYTLTFAVLLLTGAALGDRFGRRRMFIIGLVIFTAGSAAAALSPSSDVLIIARAIQGIGGAIVTPLTLTILSAARPARAPRRRARRLGRHRRPRDRDRPARRRRHRRGRQLALDLLAQRPDRHRRDHPAYLRLQETLRARRPRSTSPGLGLVERRPAGARVGRHQRQRARLDRSADPRSPWSFGAVLLVAFVGWEARADAPMLPLRMFRSRASRPPTSCRCSCTSACSASIFLLVQFFQVVQGLSPFEAGLRTLPWTAMPAFVAPDRRCPAPAASARRPILVAGHRLLAVGLALDRRGHRRRRSRTCVHAARVHRSAGIGMGLFFAPIANVVLSAVGPTRKARRRAPTTRSARSAACSAWRSWPACSQRTARTPRRPSTWTASFPPSGSAPPSSRSGPSRRSPCPAGSADQRPSRPKSAVPTSIVGGMQARTPG